MTERWVSNAKHWCKFCRVFIDGKPRSIKVHEQGDMHKAKVSQHLNELAKKRVADEKYNGAMTKELREIEIAAMKAGNRDLATGHKTGYRNSTLQQPASVVLGDKGARYAPTTWSDIAAAQFTEYDPNTFDYIEHYNKHYGHVNGGKDQQALPNDIDVSAEIAAQGEEDEDAEREWECGTCGQSNFASRKACRKCKNKRAVVEKVANEEYPGWVYDEESGSWRRKEEVLADKADQARVQVAESELQRQRDSARVAVAAVEQNAAKLHQQSKSKVKQAVIDEVEADILAAEREAAAQGKYIPDAPPGMAPPAPVKAEPEKLETDPNKRKRQLTRILWEDVGLCQTAEVADAVVAQAETELRAAVVGLSKLGPNALSSERDLCLQGITKLKQRVDMFKQRAADIREAEKPPPPEEETNTKLDEATGMGQWEVAEKPLYSERETAPEAPKQRKKKKRKNAAGEEEDDSESEEDGDGEEDENPFISAAQDKQEFLADFGYSAAVKAPKAKKVSSSDDDDEEAQQVMWKKRARAPARRAARGI